MAVYREYDRFFYHVTRDKRDPTTVYVVPLGAQPGYVEVWHDHAYSGKGLDNWRFEIGDDKFDLEFCRSTRRDPDEDVP